MTIAAWKRIKGMLRGRQRARSSPVYTHEMPPAPIDRIPPEILSIIFLHVLPPFSARDLDRVPGVLSQVCRLWRALALALPALWASLNITCNYYVLRPSLDIIHAYLLRSATSPLFIVLNTKNQDRSATPSNLQFPAVLAALVAARNRWCHISIMLVSEATQETLDVMTQGDAPLLRKFHCEYPSSGILIPLHALQWYQRLESLTWSSAQARLSPALKDETWVQLTTLKIDATLTASNCLTLLRLSPRLHTAWFRGVNSPGDASTFSSSLSHTTLHTFHAVGTHVSVLINLLILPALVSLTLDVHQHPAAPPPALYNFLSRSTPPLHYLSLFGLGISEWTLIRALSFGGALASLSVTETLPNSAPFTATLIRALHPSLYAGKKLCPRMTALRIEPLNAPDGACAEMLRARWGAEARINGVVSLEYVCIALKGDGHDRDRAEMRALNAEGMAGQLPRAL